MKKRILATIMAMAMVVTTVTPQIFATVGETQSTTKNENITTNVKYSQESTFSVIVPKKITLDSDKTSSYTVDVNGDIASDMKVVVVPDETVTMKDVNSVKADVTGTISQDKTEWLYDEMDINAKGLVSAKDLTAGTWKGVFYFNIALKGNNSLITVEAKNESGEDLNASASEITSTKKDTLLSNLVDTGLINSVDEVDALIEVESDEFDGMAETTFNVSNIANEGDKITILHFNEKTNEWEYISTETVNSDGTITANFSSYSPVAFVKVNEDGSYEVVTEQAGLYDANGNKLCTWKESGIDVETNYTDSTYKTASTSPYYVLTNNYPTATKVIIPDGVTSIGNYAFFECGRLTSITIPDGVTCIGYYTFDKCRSLTSINIPDGVTSIGGRAFNDCRSLTSINIPDSVTSIGDCAFYECTSLTSITIPEGVTSIGYYVFYNCTSLTSVTIPDSVTKIGQYAFNSCSSLTSVTFENPTGWYIGDSAGKLTTAISSSNLSNTSTAATYFKSKYGTKYWTRKI